MTEPFLICKIGQKKKNVHINEKYYIEAIYVDSFRRDFLYSRGQQLGIFVIVWKTSHPSYVFILVGQGEHWGVWFQ